MSFYSFILKIFGFKLEGKFPEYNKKVIIAAPHTSALDFIVGYLALRHFKIKPHFVIKKEFFFFPLGIILKKLGAIPIDRGNIKNNFVDLMVNEFNKREKFNLVITPEGTRKRTKHWKKGFYLIAQKANVPIVVTKLDYGNKILGPVKTIMPSGNYNKDLKNISECYKGVIGKIPENFELPIINE
ncbi:MAG: 1-acyl-sn-glycerol-3-phosphate acyltransferase [Bacteroidales bacterium]|nr:1-acyl-sn-glycerol-3-phosphate acyltransferase [Bacteroidales bacterium]